MDKTTPLSGKVVIDQIQHPVHDAVADEGLTTASLSPGWVLPLGDPVGQTCPWEIWQVSRYPRDVTPPEAA
jgi:hypothetical protein